MNIKRYFFEHELSQITHELFVNDYIHEKFESVHDYDVVIGPIANDKVGVQIRKYVDKEISLKNQEILLLLKYVL